MELRDYDVHKEHQEPLSPRAEKVLTYLEVLHQGDKGKQGNAHVERMETALNIEERDIRFCIREIIEKGKAVIGNRKGYYIAITPEEIKEANDLEIARIKSSLTRLAQNEGSFGTIYSHMNDLVKKYPHIADGQLDISGQEEKKTPHRPK